MYRDVTAPEAGTWDLVLDAFKKANPGIDIKPEYLFNDPYHQKLRAMAQADQVMAPNLWGVVFTCSILAISGSLKSFDLIWAMTAGGPARYTEVLGIYLYQATFHYAVNPYGMGGAASVVIILISVFLIKLVEFLFRTFTRKLD